MTIFNFRSNSSLYFIFRMDDILFGSSESEDVSSEEEVPPMFDFPDNVTYRWPKNIVEIGEASVPDEPSNRKIREFILEQ